MQNQRQYSRIFHLTDLHLFADRRGRKRGVDTTKSFVSVLGSLSQEDKNNLLVLTGDLAEDEQLETYQLLKRLLESWSEQYSVLPGNHDAPELLQTALGPLQ